MTTNQNGSALIILLTVVACLSVFFIMEFVYEEEDMANLQTEVEVEDINGNMDEKLV